MPELNKELVVKLSRLARLKLSEDEINEFLPQLGDVLKIFSKLNEVDIKNTEPSFQPIELKNVFREDVIEPSLKREEVLSNTKHKEKGFFKGPRAF